MTLQQTDRLATSTPPAANDRVAGRRGVPASRRRRRFLSTRPDHLWWVTPLGSVVMVVPLSLLVATRIPDADYRLFYKAPRVIDTGQAELFLAAAGLLVLGTLFPLALSRRPVRRGWPTLPRTQLGVLRSAERIAFALTTLGYVLLALLGAGRGATPSLLINAVVSQDNYDDRLKTVFAPVAGVTSLTQIGIAYVVIAGLLLCHGRSAKLVRRLVIVVVLGLLRAYLLSERLAVLELLVPLVAIGAAQARHRGRKRWLPFAPLFALPVLLVVFGAFEYSRSWVYYRTRTTQSFPQFVVGRLAGYYATSYNNGALQLDHNTGLGRLPYDSIQGFWTAPGIAQLGLYHRLTGQNGGDLLNNTLAQYGNPEFNNPGGLAVPLIDFGRTYGLLFFLAAGVVIGFAYRSWREGRIAGLLAYPVLFTGLLELPRYLYWTEGRVVPAYLFLAVTAIVAHRAGKAPLRPGGVRLAARRRRSGPVRT